MARKELCFVIMPFNEEFDPIWESLKKAGKRFEYLKIERSDTQVPSKSSLFQDIKEAINLSAFVIADVSRDKRYRDCPNPNVMTEAGFALGVGKEPYLISRKPLVLPSDWSQNKVAVYDHRNIDDLDDWFEKYLERIMIGHNIDTDKVIQRRTTQPEKFNWLLNMVQQLRGRAKETYEDNLWTINQTVFKPDSCTFSLCHRSKPNSQNPIELIEIRCGVFFADWNRRNTPFRIQVRLIDENRREIKEETKRYDICLQDSVETVSIEKVWEAFEEKLDSALREFTPAVSTLTPLAKNVKIMEDVAAQLKRIEMDGIGAITKRLVWKSTGYSVPYFIKSDRSPIELSINFQRWEEDGNTQYWIRFKPFNFEDAPAVDSWLKNAEFDGSAWFIPIYAKTNIGDDIVEQYKEALEKILHRYKPLEIATTVMGKTDRILAESIEQPKLQDSCLEIEEETPDIACEEDNPSIQEQPLSE